MLKIIQKIVTHGITLLLVCVLLSVSFMPAAHASGDNAVKSNQTIYIDGWSVLITAYNINGSNYVRLRDIGYMIDFDVRFDNVSNAIYVFTSAPYSGEQDMIGQTPERAEVAGTQLLIYVDGQEKSMSAYNIGGNNYIRLRDVAEVVDFGVEWDASRRRVLIDTAKPYTPETPESSVSVATPMIDTSAGTGVDYSLQANPAIFDSYYTREKYNVDRQRILDTGTTVNWGIKSVPQSTEAVAAANRFFDSLTQMSQFEIVQAINVFLCARITYSLDVEFIADDFWTDMTYGVCEDYARMFQYMCYRAGIPCLYVSGIRVPASYSGRHAWNEVYVDGKWLFYDGTFSKSHRSISLSEAAETANAGFVYSINYPEQIIYRKELFIPGSTL